MAQLISDLADVQLVGGYSVTFEAIDPSTGAAVTGVKVSAVAIYGDTDNSGTSGTGEWVLGPFEVTPEAPLWAPIPTGIGEDTGG